MEGDSLSATTLTVNKANGSLYVKGGGQVDQTGDVMNQTNTIKSKGKKNPATC